MFVLRSSVLTFNECLFVVLARKMTYSTSLNLKKKNIYPWPMAAPVRLKVGQLCKIRASLPMVMHNRAQTQYNSCRAPKHLKLRQPMTLLSCNTKMPLQLTKQLWLLTTLQLQTRERRCLMLIKQARMHPQPETSYLESTGSWSTIVCQRSTSTTSKQIQSLGMKMANKTWISTLTMGSQRRLGATTQKRCFSAHL